MDFRILIGVFPILAVGWSVADLDPCNATQRYEGNASSETAHMQTIIGSNEVFKPEKSGSTEVESKDKFAHFPPWNSFIEILSDKVSNALDEGKNTLNNTIAKGCESRMESSGFGNPDKVPILGHYSKELVSSFRSEAMGTGEMARSGLVPFYRGNSPYFSQSDWGKSGASEGPRKTGMKIYQQKTKEGEFIMESPVEEDTTPRWGPGMFQYMCGDTSNPNIRPEPPLSDWWKVVTMRSLQHTQRVKYLGKDLDKISRYMDVESVGSSTPIEGYLVKANPGKNIENLLGKLQAEPEIIQAPRSHKNKYIPRVSSGKLLPKTVGFGNKLDSLAKKTTYLKQWDGFS